MIWSYLYPGGVFKGWLTLDIKIKVRNLSDGEDGAAAASMIGVTHIDDAAPPLSTNDVK